MPTDEEQHKLDEYGQQILDLEMKIEDTAKLLKNQKEIKKEMVQLYSALRKTIDRKENDTTLDDFEGEENPQDFDYSCPECNSSNVLSGGLMGDKMVCQDCDHEFELPPPAKEHVVTCPLCDADNIEIDEEDGSCTCQECAHTFIPEMPDPDEEHEKWQEEETAKIEAIKEKRRSEREGEPDPVEGEVDEDVQVSHYKWLVGVGATDVNFKSTLQESNLATVNQAIKWAEEQPSGQVTRLKALNRRKNQLEKESA
ncbi:MAG: hypothetical protein DRJ03_27380 [Chloroflexi bacterium]|nr:MAG: hypothetical protein DRJ03_27380 [Chloroflexota bacterium]